MGGVTCLIKRLKARIGSHCRTRVSLITEDSISTLPFPVKIPWEHRDYLSEEVSDIKGVLIVGAA